MIILAAKLKNAIKKANPNGKYTFHLANTSINGRRTGCSGFVVNNDNNSIVYVTTEECCMRELSLMHRYVDSIKDYRGYYNKFSDDLDSFAKDIVKTLTKTVVEARERKV